MRSKGALKMGFPKFTPKGGAEVCIEKLDAGFPLVVKVAIMLSISTEFNILTYK